jgi:hypothetical protein
MVKGKNMKIVAIFLAVLILFFGLRMVLTALQTALSGKVLVRQGFRTRWQPAPDMNEAWKIAFRDGLLGLLLIVLAFMMLF